MKSGSLEVRAETVNLLRATNFDLPNRFAFTQNFGKIFSAGPGKANSVWPKIVVLSLEASVVRRTQRHQVGQPVLPWASDYGGDERLDNEDGCASILRAGASGCEFEPIAQARCDVDDAHHGSVYAHAP